MCGDSSRPASVGGAAFCLGVFLWLATALTGLAATRHLVLVWDISPDPTVTGYMIYAKQGTNSVVPHNVGAGLATNILDHLTNSIERGYMVSNCVVEATYEFWATAYNADGLESDDSNHIFYTVPKWRPRPPGGFHHSAFRQTRSGEPPAFLRGPPPVQISLGKRKQVAGQNLIRVRVPG